MGRSRAAARLSPALAHALGAAVECSAASRDGAPDVYFFYDHELFFRGHVNNGLDELVAFYGPMAANYDWNVTFVGKMEHERIVAVRWEQAKAMGLDVAEDVDCVSAR
jgi:hypothetical protein